MIRDVVGGAGQLPVVDVSGRGLGRDDLMATIDRTREALRSIGIGRNDRVVLVGRDGPRMAVGFLSIASAGPCAPLAPTLPSPALVDAVTALDGRLVVSVDPLHPDAVAELAKRGVPAVMAREEQVPTFTLDLDGLSGSAPSPDGPAEPDDVALILRTSGTTGTPKTVPLTGAALIGSATTIGRHLDLDVNDVGLLVMPLFHIHGLVAGLLAPLVSGGTVACSPGFSASDMASWITRIGATWFTAVPTMHQALVARHHTHPLQLGGHRLRFVRSSSSSMPPAVLSEIESLLGVPMIEAYGMTEAAHQMASNPLPPAHRRPGSVGLASGVEIRIFDAEDRDVEIGVDGDVLVAGPNLFAGYSDPPGANSDAFVGSWFRTGDIGHLDDDGYLYLTGRRKEMINRGGESIAPRQIDDVLLDHPAVAEALSFGVPDRRLGEQVAALAVLRQGVEVDEPTLREFLAERLDRPKVPRRVIFVDEIPQGPTGKPQRVGLADRLGLIDLDGDLEPVGPDRPPETEVEAFIAGLWTEVLQTDVENVHARWLDVGGDSLLAMRLLGRIAALLDLEIGIIDFFDRSTVAAQAQLLEGMLTEAAGE